MRLPVVAIIGQPNTGKSSLFNRIINKRYAITAREAGTTRDRIYHKVENPDIDFLLVDTGGLEIGKSGHNLEEDIKRQALVAVEDADIILFTIDSKQEQLESSDFYIADYLRKNAPKKTKIILIFTKCDHGDNINHLVEAYRFGFGDPVHVSSFHKLGTEQLKDTILQELKRQGFKKIEMKEEGEDAIPQIAVVGKPNVGKSSLINGILNEEKLIVSDIPGTTVDNTDTAVTFHKETYNFIDTAGIRRRGKIKKGIEKFSVLRSLQAIYRSDIALLVLNAEEDISKQDQSIAGEIVEQNRGCIIIVNKWDTQETGTEARHKFLDKLQYNFPFLAWAPVLFVSAKTRKNIPKLFPLINDAMRERTKRISTAVLNQFLRDVMSKRSPTGTKRVRPKIYYITQVGVSPPHFIFFVNKKSSFHFSYRRFLHNRLREYFGFVGTSIRVEFKEKEQEEKVPTKKTKKAIKK